MSKLYAFVADGMEEVECLAVVDIARRGGIQVELISDKKLKNQSGKEGEIPYEILADTTAFTKARYTTAGEETVLGITIDRESWKKAPSGSYADTVTFQISYVDATD